MESERFQLNEHYSPNEPESQRSEPGEVFYEILRSPELRTEYVTLTDSLISKLAEQQTNVAIFLDKSARPVAWLVQELWGTLAPKDPETGQPIRKPEIKFLNIDREQWGAIIGRSETEVGGINVDRLPPERLEELRAVYAPVAGVSNPGEISLLDGKRVMVIDEVRMSGDTLTMSKQILRKAFPEANEIDGAYWMPRVARRDSRSGAYIGGEVPVWYSDREVTGRLVGNRDTTKSTMSNSSRQRIGRFWLSAAFRTPDESGRQLKREVKQLAEDLKHHKIVYMPSPEWDDSLEPLDVRIPRIDGISLDTYVELRKSSFDKTDFLQRYSEIVKQ